METDNDDLCMYAIHIMLNLSDKMPNKYDKKYMDMCYHYGLKLKYDKDYLKSILELTEKLFNSNREKYVSLFAEINFDYGERRNDGYRIELATRAVMELFDENPQKYISLADIYAHKFYKATGLTKYFPKVIEAYEKMPKQELKKYRGSYPKILYNYGSFENNNEIMKRAYNIACKSEYSFSNSCIISSYHKRLSQLNKGE